MFSFKFIKNFIFCLATIVTGFSYSGFANNVTAHPGVITELVIDSEETDKLYSSYFFQKVSTDHFLSDFSNFRFNCYLNYQNNHTAIGAHLFKLEFLDIKPVIIQQLEIPTRPILASLFRDFHNYFFPLPGKLFLLEITNPPGVGHYSNYEKVQKNYKRGVARTNDCPCSNSSFPYPGFPSGQGPKIYHGTN